MPSVTGSHSSLRILIVEDEETSRAALRTCLAQEGHEIIDVTSVESALAEVGKQAFDLIFLDFELGVPEGMDYIPSLLLQNPWTRLVIITAGASVETAVEAMKHGASDYLPKPFEAAQALHVTQKVAERRRLERKIEALQAAMGSADHDADLHSVDPAMIAVLALAHRVAPTQATLVMRGEIGTGKARLAHAIHLWSDRASEPFGTVVCRADAGEAMETELFGVVSPEGKPAGKVEFCDGGTLLLQEVGELPMRLQPAIIRLLKDQEFERPDESTRRRCNVRVIATTSTDLDVAVAAGTFRADLLLALNVVQIDIPPLRQRPTDIPFLAERYLALFGRRAQRPSLTFSREAMHVLTRYGWPGNVRELRNVVERAILLCTGETVDVSHLPPNMLNSKLGIAIGDLIPLAVVEEAHIRRVVKSARSLRQAATILGIDSGTVVRKMKRYVAADEQIAHE